MTDKPIIALLYDFDKTLCTTDMEDYAFIPALGYTPAQFWDKANTFGRDNRMDGLLAYMYTMIAECRAQGKRLDRDFLVQCGHSMELFPGVREWFGRINAFGEEQGVTIEHYVISSGLREIIEGSGIAHEFREIYACEFFYNAEGLAAWPKLDVNFTNKTQFVYRINKGVLDVSDDKTLNDSMPDDSKRIPFTNMIYVGDGLSDVPCMKMMRAYGGQAIAVYQAGNRVGVEDLLSKGRVDFIFPADYREGTGLDSTVKNIIRKMAISDALTAEVLESLGIGLEAHMDLVNPASDKMDEGLHSLGFKTKDEIVGQKTLQFDISQFMTMLYAVAPGNTDFKLTATDASGQNIKSIMLYVPQQ
jgi:hypothetical protein